MLPERNIFLYWVGKEYKLISVLRNLIYLHSNNGKGYKVHLINQKNINEYVKVIPDYFYTLNYAHQADYVRVHVVYDYGGIWLDSDSLVMNSLDSLFDIVENQNGFFIKENNDVLWNGIFGSKKNTPLLLEWKNRMKHVLDAKKSSIDWTQIGNAMLQDIKHSNPRLYDNYKIFDGCDTMYSVNWNNCVKEFIEKPYDNYKNIIKNYQPVIALVNSVYKRLENLTEQQILKGNLPLNYFINKSIENMNTFLIDYDFIEIGTSNFDTLIQNAGDNTKGISVDAVKYYIDNLPDKPNVKKYNIGISNVNTTLDVYYIPEDVIINNRLADWFKGCNCINDYHPLHKKHNVTHLCKIEKVNVITTYELFYQNKVRKVGYLKIDTEGHDCVILKSLHSYLKYLPKEFYPKKILFESNEHTSKIEVDDTIKYFTEIGYRLQSRGYDTVLVHD